MENEIVKAQELASELQQQLERLRIFPVTTESARKLEAELELKVNQMLNPPEGFSTLAFIVRERHPRWLGTPIHCQRGLGPRRYFAVIHARFLGNWWGAANGRLFATPEGYVFATIPSGEGADEAVPY